jgi:hypothetical protein
MVKALVQSLESFLNYGTFVLFQDRRHKYKFFWSAIITSTKGNKPFIASKQSSHTRAERNFRYSNPAFRDEQLLQTTWKQSKYSLVMLYA